MKSTLLWLDDERDPHKNDNLRFSPIGRDVNIVWVKNFSQFVRWISDNGLPTAINFDHDLGVKYPSYSDEEAKGKKFIEMATGNYIEGTVEYPTGMDCAKFLVNYCIDNEKPLPLYAIQSQNPVGKSNIDGLLKSFLKHQNKNKNNF